MDCPKSSFTTSQQASIALVRIRRDPATVKVPVRFYQCPACHRWHLTSQPLRTDK
jgi:hypothetical protein